MIPCVPAVFCLQVLFFLNNLVVSASVIRCHCCPVVLCSKHMMCLAFRGDVLIQKMELASVFAQFL